TEPFESVTQQPQYNLDRLYIFDRIKSLPVPKYKPGESLRSWLLQFQQEASTMGISTMNDCAPCLSMFMPPIVSRYMFTLASSIKQSWSLCTEKLLTQFSLPIEEERRQLIIKLK
ncbi:hypothetical protein BD560DRAFT_300490, partial [Blakeslea trispora]